MLSRLGAVARRTLGLLEDRRPVSEVPNVLGSTLPEVRHAKSRVSLVRKRLLSVASNNGDAQPLILELIAASRRLGALEEAAARRGNK